MMLNEALLAFDLNRGLFTRKKKEQPLANEVNPPTAQLETPALLPSQSPVAPRKSAAPPPPSNATKSTKESAKPSTSLKTKVEDKLTDALFNYTAKRFVREVHKNNERKEKAALGPGAPSAESERRPQSPWPRSALTEPAKPSAPKSWPAALKHRQLRSVAAFGVAGRTIPPRR